MKYIKLDHSITGAYWQPEEGMWEVRGQRMDGSTFVDKCHVLVNGGGVLKYEYWPSLVHSC
jgi:hypothetical protein